MNARDAFLSGAGRVLFALPPRAQRVLGGRVPPDAAGLEPDAWLVALFDQRLDAGPPGSEPLAERRERFAREVAKVSVRPRVPVAASDATVAGATGPLAARLYVPVGAPERGPLLVFFHGGGWVEGSPATHEPSCLLLAHLAGVRVISADYRLAPEHPFPAAADDAVAVYADVARRAAEFGADPARLAVGGDSAGGNLAAVVAQAMRAQTAVPAPAFQLLIYPGLDMSRKRDSRLRFGAGFLLTEASMTWYEDQYVPDRAQRSDPRVSPLLTPDLSGLPTAHIATGLADPLRDEGEAYAERLREAGVRVALQRHAQIHGFFNITVMRSGLRSLTLIAGALRQGLA